VNLVTLDHSVTVMGFDQAKRATGWAVIKNGSIQSFGVIETRPNADLQEWLHELYIHAHRIVQDHRPDLVGIERTYRSPNAKTDFSLAAAMATVLLAVTNSGHEVLLVSPQTCNALYGISSGTERKERRIAIMKAAIGPGYSEHVYDAIAIAEATLLKLRERRLGEAVP
jgi:Holliday junction resolvasome RuvABC endonuclease subunit